MFRNRSALLSTIGLMLLIADGAQSRSHSTNPSEKYSQVYKQYQTQTCPIPKSQIQHFVYFARDREALQGHALLDHPRFAGAQIMYAWKRLEPEFGVYDFSEIQADIAYLARHHKKLFIQLQDTTFDPNSDAVPGYLHTAAYDGGVLLQRDDAGTPEGWVAKRWNAKVRERFAALLMALGQAVDASIAGINLQESAIGVSQAYDPSFTAAGYRDALQANMLALKKAFPTAVKLQYANFMPDEWLPWEDKGYLRSIYAFGNANGVGLGAPDLMIQRKGQLNHALTLMHETRYQVPLGIAIQDGNYIGETATDTVKAKRQNLVPILHAFAEDFLKVDYLFWVNQEPYFSQDVLTCFARK